MNVHEYQAKALLREFGIPVPNGVPVFNLEIGQRGEVSPQAIEMLAGAGRVAAD